jgi:hypothetical protein
MKFSTGSWLKNFNRERDPAGKSDPDQPDPDGKFFLLWG